MALLLLKTSSVNYHNEILRKKNARSALTLLEAIIAISVLGVGVATTIGALTKFNSVSAVSRNATGAYTVVMNQIDLFQSMSPFNPQKTNENTSIQVPKDLANNPPTYDMTVGTHTIGYMNASTGVVSNEWPVYQYKDPSGATIVVKGTLTIQVTDLSSTLANTYQAVVTLKYDYLNKTRANGKPYVFSMSTIRTSDI